MPKSGVQERKLSSSKKALRDTSTPCNTAANSLDVMGSLDLANVPVDRDILSPQKVAEHIAQSTHDGDESPIRRMPDNIMLEILGYLSAKELCRAACTCRGWNHLVRQKPLWKHVDLSPFRINLVSIRKLVFAYFSDSLRSLCLSGFLMSVKSTECVSDSLLIELDKRCPKLEELSITSANLAGVNSVNLPSKLSALTLIKCNYPTFWLSGAFKQGKLDALKRLDLAGSNGFGARDVECLTPKPLTSLSSVRLGACYRVGHRGAGRIADNCPNLEELDLHRVPLSNRSLEKIGSGLARLRVLDLSGCTNSENVLFDLHHLCPLKRLEELHITDSEQFAGDVLVGLVNVLPKLKLLRVSRKPNLTEDHVKQMKNACPMPPGVKEGGDSVWRLNFYPHDQLLKLAQTQSHR